MSRTGGGGGEAYPQPLPERRGDCLVDGTECLLFRGRRKAATGERRGGDECRV